MIDFNVLQFIWWGLIGLTLIIYATTAGFDFGATMILPFMRSEDEQRVLLNASGRTWDGNQTWLVFAGGALFVIWPAVYASVFSGLYAAMYCILWSFFLRPPGYDYRSKINKKSWRQMWNIGLFISAFLPTFIFGVVFGNLLEGLPILFDPFSLRPYYEGNFFGLINWFGVVCGIVALLMFLMHGAAMLHRRTEGSLKKRMRRLFYIFSVLFLIVFTGAGFMVAFYVKGYFLVTSPENATLHPLANVVTEKTGAWIISYIQYPWKAVGPLIAYIATFMAILTMRVGRGGFAFWCSVMALAGAVLTVGLALFPFIVPSSVKPAESMTVWNATSAHYTLNIMFYVAIILLAIILVYKIFTYWAVWKDKPTISVDDVKENNHTYY